MVDGFYLMQLETVQGSGGGVIVLTKDRSSVVTPVSTTWENTNTMAMRFGRR
jgi:hypothetical protein